MINHLVDQPVSQNRVTLGYITTALNRPFTRRIVQLALCFAWVEILTLYVYGAHGHKSPTVYSKFPGTVYLAAHTMYT